MSLDNEFRLFVNFYNKVNNTNVSVGTARKSKMITELFANNYISAQQVQQVREENSKFLKSTKRKAYELVNLPKVDSRVYNHLTCGIFSRADIAKDLNMRLSTVCGAVSRLIDADFVKVYGTTVDTDSMREVELVGAK